VIQFGQDNRLYFSIVSLDHSVVESEITETMVVQGTDLLLIL
jgi:hypothetical protein